VRVFRVLIVEDEPEILDLIGDLLTLEGYDVHTLRRIPHGLDPIRALSSDCWPPTRTCGERRSWSAPARPI
jgi:CheY-like chemotaxis protein